MSEPHPHLARAPITEALVDIRVDAPELTLEQVTAVHDALRQTFPDKHDLVEQTLELDVNSSATRPVNTNLGWLAWSADHSRAMQARTNGFTFSRLPQYQDWDELCTEARQAWSIYSQAVKPRSVSRVAVRYINRINLPQPIGSFGDYFQTFPRIGSSLPQTLSGVFVRLLIPFNNITASIIQTIDVVNVTELSLPVVLDIDVFRDAELAPDSEHVWLALDELRDIKNQVFFGSITDKVMEMCK